MWSFGDSATSTSQNPTHTYAAPGDKDVTLEVTNFYGTTWTMQTVAVVSAEGQIFADGFETGDCDRWSREVP